MIIFIQNIVIEWDKRSRDCFHASMRNKISPVHIPLEPSEGNGIFFQRILYPNKSYEKPSINELKRIDENYVRQNNIEFSQKKEDLEVGFTGLRTKSGIVKKIGVLSKNNWLQIVSNRRERTDYTWIYKKFVYNIFYGNSTNLKNLLCFKPILVFDNQVQLNYNGKKVNKNRE